MNAGRRRPTDAERVEVILCVLPWLAANDGAPLAEVAELFGVDPELLRADLDNVFLNVEPDGAGSAVDVNIDEEDDDYVSVVLPGSFEEPPRLDHSEALLLLAAGSALVGEPGSDAALEPALSKLVAALGDGAATALQVELGSGDPSARELLHGAVRSRSRVSIKYFSWGSDEVTERTVDPWALRSVSGHWYLTGHCHDRGAMRHFRLDRVLSAELVGDPEAFDTPGHVEAPDRDFAADGRSIRLCIPHEAAWLVESHPVESWHDGDDGITVTMGVHNDAWLDRLLLRLPASSDAIDIDSGEDLLPRRAAAARRILARHEAAGDDEIHR